MTMPSKKANVVLWIVQGLLALLYLFAGAMKFVMPMDQMTKGMPVALPGWFLYFIGVAEVLGAIGLIVPAATRIRPGLTPLAAAGLAVIMIGAVTVTVMGGPVGPAGMPFVAGALAAVVAWGR